MEQIQTSDGADEEKNQEKEEEIRNTDERINEDSKKDDLVSKSSLVALAIAYLSVFIDILGVSIILPIIPFLAMEFDASAQEIGYIYAGYAGAQMISVPVSGKLSDVFGRRPLMLLSLFGSFAGFMFQGLAWNILSFICARVVAGAFGGSIPICQSYIADVIPVEQRGRYFAILGSVIITAFLFGPGIGAGLSQFSLQTPMFVAAGVALFGWFVAFFFFKEPTRQKDSKKVPKEDVNIDPNIGIDTDGAEMNSLDESGSKQGAISVTDPHNHYSQYSLMVKLMWMGSFFQMLAFSSIIYFFGLFVFDQFGWEALEVGFATMLMGVFQVIVQIILYPKIQVRLGKHGCGVLGCVAGCGGLLLLGFVTGRIRQFHGVPLMCIALTLTAFGNAMVVPSLSSVLSRYTSQARQGATLGVAQSAEAFARTIGPLLWGGIYSTSRQLPFQVSTVFYLLAGTMFYIVLHLNRRLPEHRTLVESGAEGGEGAEEGDNEDGTDGELQMTRLVPSGSLDASNADSEESRVRLNSREDTTMTEREQLRMLAEENRVLREKLRQYEEMFELGNSPELLDIQTFHK